MNALLLEMPVNLQRRATDIAFLPSQKSTEKEESNEIGDEERSVKKFCGSHIQCHSPYATGFSARKSMILPMRLSVGK